MKCNNYDLSPIIHLPISLSLINSNFLINKKYKKTVKLDSENNEISDRECIIIIFMLLLHVASTILTRNYATISAYMTCCLLAWKRSYSLQLKTRCPLVMVTARLLAHCVGGEMGPVREWSVRSSMASAMGVRRHTHTHELYLLSAHTYTHSTERERPGQLISAKLVSFFSFSFLMSKASLSLSLYFYSHYNWWDYISIARVAPR